MQCQIGNDKGENLGHFRLSVSSDPAALDRERNHLAATKLTDPVQKLALAYKLIGDQRAIDQLLERRPNLTGAIGDFFTQEPKKDWQRAVEIYSKAISPQTTDADLLARRARAYDALENWEAAADDWSRAAAGKPDGARLLAEFARDLDAGGQVVLARIQFEKSQALYEQMLAVDPESELVAPELAQLLSAKLEKESPIRWKVLQPTEMKSAGGATLTKLDDDSILASGTNPPSDEYTVAFILPERMQIHSIRLEALTHDSLPRNGPGREKKFEGGVFALTGWDLTAKHPDSAASPRRLSFRAFAADHSWQFDPSSGQWNITAATGKNHTSVWRLQEPITLEAGSELRSHMRFNPDPNYSDENLGRFRISVASDPAVFDREQTRFAATKRTDPWLTLASAYHLCGDQQSLEELVKHHPEAASGVGDVAAKPRRTGSGRSPSIARALPISGPTSPCWPNSLRPTSRPAARARRFQRWRWRPRPIRMTRCSA